MGVLEEAGERLEEAKLALPPRESGPGAGGEAHPAHPAAASIASSVGMLGTMERQLREITRTLVGPAGYIFLSMSSNAP